MLRLRFGDDECEAGALEQNLSGNLFIDHLPTETARRLLPRLERSSPPMGTVVATPGQRLSHVLFPINSAVSSVTSMRDGTEVEVAITGREGFFGINVALGTSPTTTVGVVQLAGSVLRIRADEFRTLLFDDPGLLQRALGYTQAVLDILGQFSGCNRVHRISERFARWLLMAHDRVESDQLKLTHEYLATMLGVRRPSVSISAATFDRAGIIAYTRGTIHILDRAALEAASCECYAAADAHLSRLMGYSAVKRAA